MSYLLFISWTRTRCFEHYTVYTSYSLPESQNLSKLVPAVTWISLSIKLVVLRRQWKRNPGQSLPWPATGIPRNKDWRGADNNVSALRTDWFILTADFWLDETLFPRVRKSLRDCDWMKKFPYEFFMRSILCEKLSKYEIIHLTPKWPPFQYSFVYLKMSPCCLV